MWCMSDMVVIATQRQIALMGLLFESICFKAICNMGLLFYIKNMQTVSVIGEKPLHATRGKNATTTGEIASGLTAYASDIAMH